MSMQLNADNKKLTIAVILVPSDCLTAMGIVFDSRRETTLGAGKNSNEKRNVKKIHFSVFVNVRFQLKFAVAN